MNNSSTFRGKSGVIFVFFVVFALAVAGSKFWRQTMQPAVSAPGVLTPEPVQAPFPVLNAWVVYAGQDLAAGQGKISLPTGARFAVKARANVSGQVAFYTINPQGVRSEKPLWKTAVEGGQSVTGPNLRLQGSTGLETLRVLFTPNGVGNTLEQHIQIWHLGQ